MKWFKHDSDAHADAKLKRVRIKYGMEGYGLYWYCLELIARDVSDTRLTFDLEHDAELIAHDTGIHYERVQEMMIYMVDLKLFENQSGILTCLKMAKRLDQSMTSNPQMRRVIAEIKKSHDSVMTPSEPNHDSVMQDKIRLDKNRLDKSKGGKPPKKRTRFIPPSLQDVIDYKKSRDSPVDPNRFVDFYMSKDWMVGKTKMKDWKAAFRNWESREGDNREHKQTSQQQRANYAGSLTDYGRATEF